MDNRKLNVLLIEDHQDSAHALAALVRAFGHTASIAGNCHEARLLFDAEFFDLLLCDLGLPDGDGCDLARDLRDIRAVPAVAITGYGMDDDINRCRDAGLLTHITKPIVADRLRAILDDISHSPAAVPLAQSGSSSLDRR